jgi:hypothetical protein
MQRLYQVTVPGLDVVSDWRVVHDRLLDQFAEVTDVLATTMKGTILLVYEGSADPDEWLETVANRSFASGTGSTHGTGPRRRTAP